MCCHFLDIQGSGEKAHLLRGFSGPTPEVEAGHHHGLKGSWELGYSSARGALASSTHIPGFHPQHRIIHSGECPVVLILGRLRQED